MHKSIVNHDGRRCVENAPSQDGRRARLLVADDNETNRRLMSVVLAPVHALVTFAVDGIEALRAAAESSFDLILMDIQMPRMDGLEATRRIREVEATRSARRTPIFAVTASAIQYDGDQYRAVGMDRVICKPIDITTLLAAVSDVLALIEFRFVGVDASGRWREVRYAAFKNEIAARTFGRSLLSQFPAVLIYRNDRRIAVLAQIA
jgi:CheY-like chemotaxis protein